MIYPLLLCLPVYDGSIRLYGIMIYTRLVAVIWGQGYVLRIWSLGVGNVLMHCLLCIN